jgi:hypothetical protein
VAPTRRGKAGPAGTTGAPGAAGPAGPAGATGPAGPQGPQGVNGANGEPGKEGKQGKEGKEGKEGTFGGQSLPAGKTLTGAYAATGFGEAAFPEPGFGVVEAGVSFALPVPDIGSASAQLEVHYIKEGETPPAGCTGDENEPGAEEGNLCVFGGAETNLQSLPAAYLKGSSTTTMGFTVRGVSAAKGYLDINGTWAVTAK